MASVRFRAATGTLLMPNPLLGQAGWAPRLSDNTEEPVPFLFLCLLKDTVFGACSRARGHDVTPSDASGIHGSFCLTFCSTSLRSARVRSTLCGFRLLRLGLRATQLSCTSSV